MRAGKLPSEVCATNVGAGEWHRHMVCPRGQGHSVRDNVTKKPEDARVAMVTEPQQADSVVWKRPIWHGPDGGMGHKRESCPPHTSKPELEGHVHEKVGDNLQHVGVHA